MVGEFYCPPREMGEKPSPLGEDVRSTFLPQGVRGSRVNESMTGVIDMTTRILGPLVPEATAFMR